MENCPFQALCVRIRFDSTPCTSASIDSEQCVGPVIKGRGTVIVANISSGNYKIAIMSQCPTCKKLWGIVPGDTEPIPYRVDSVILSDEKKKRIPNVICQECSKPNAERDALLSPVLKAQAVA